MKYTQSNVIQLEKRKLQKKSMKGIVKRKEYYLLIYNKSVKCT